MRRRAAVIVLDGVGIGAAADAAQYGDAGSDTLGHVADAVGGLDLPHLERLGLGCIRPLRGVRVVASPAGAWGLMEPRSAGKDSTTGHWEIAGLRLARPFPTYPRGFPAAIISEFARRTGRPVVGNIAGSGTAVIDRYAEEHRRRGAWIVYTSVDSVFQVASHVAVAPLTELYAACAEARDLLTAPHDVSRVIARPFAGSPGAYVRTSARRDFSLPPPGETLLDALAAAGIARHSVGKVDELFAGRGIAGEHAPDNAAGVAAIGRWLAEARSGLLFANLVDFDQVHGHRNDVPGFYTALQDFDRSLPALTDRLREDDLLFITADHGNDPTTASTDHARECVPLLVAGPAVRASDLGRRSTFADVGATVADWLGCGYRGCGTSFLAPLVGA